MSNVHDSTEKKPQGVLASNRPMPLDLTRILARLASLGSSLDARNSVLAGKDRPRPPQGLLGKSARATASKREGIRPGAPLVTFSSRPQAGLAPGYTAWLGLSYHSSLRFEAFSGARFDPVE